MPLSYLYPISWLPPPPLFIHSWLSISVLLLCLLASGLAKTELCLSPEAASQAPRGKHVGSFDHCYLCSVHGAQPGSSPALRAPRAPVRLSSRPSSSIVHAFLPSPYLCSSRSTHLEVLYAPHTLSSLNSFSSFSHCAYSFPQAPLSILDVFILQ